jgi:hypothetical protein
VDVTPGNSREKQQTDCVKRLVDGHHDEQANERRCHMPLGEIDMVRVQPGEQDPCATQDEAQHRANEVDR